MIKVYGKENCGRCETLKRTLERKGLAPVVEKDGKFYTMENFLEVI